MSSTFPSKSFHLKKDCELIESIKPHPILYSKDPTMNKYQHIKATKAVWEEVALKTNMTVVKCKTRWAYIKNRYFNLRAGKESTCKPKIYRRNLKYMDGTLDFLDPFIHSDNPDSQAQAPQLQTVFESESDEADTSENVIPGIQVVEDTQDAEMDLESILLDENDESNIDTSEDKFKVGSRLETNQSVNKETDGHEIEIEQTLCDQPSMSSIPCTTSSEDIYFVEIIKQHPILYSNDPALTRCRQADVRKSTWEEVALKTNMPLKKCKSKWASTKHRYVKLSRKKRTGKVKYMNGALDFLDPIIQSDNPDSRLQAPRIKKFYKSVSDKADSSENVIPGIQVIEEYTEDIEMEPECILPDENDESSSGTNEDVFTVGSPLLTGQSVGKEIGGHKLEQTLSDTIIKIEEETNDHTNDSYTDIVITPDSPKDSSSLINTSLVNHNFATDTAPDPLKVFLMKYDIDNDNKTDLKQYMNDLAEVLCRRLAIEKRKNFLDQIDLLVSEMLED